MAGDLAEVTWGVGAGQGWLWGGECGGSRLVDSEKSPIVTRRRCVGLGGLIENVVTRAAFSHGTRGWDLSHLQDIAVLARCCSPRYAAGVRRLTWSELSAALPWAGRFTRLVARAVSRGDPVLQVTVDSGNGLCSVEVEPVRLKVVCSQVDRAWLNHNPECIRLNLKVLEPPALTADIN